MTDDDIKQLADAAWAFVRKNPGKVIQFSDQDHVAATKRAGKAQATRSPGGRASAKTRRDRAEERRAAIRALLRKPKREPSAGEIARRLEAKGHVNAKGKRWSESTIRTDLRDIRDENPASS